MTHKVHSYKVYLRILYPSKALFQLYTFAVAKALRPYITSVDGAGRVSHTRERERVRYTKSQHNLLAFEGKPQS
jgi:hypothetical protein